MNSKYDQYMEMLVNIIGADKLDFLERINPKNINSSGWYMICDSAGNLVSAGNLKVVEIEFLRMLYRNDDIASKVMIDRNELFKNLENYHNYKQRKGEAVAPRPKETKPISRQTNQPAKVRLDRTQKYNKNCKTKQPVPRRAVSSLLVMGITVSVFAGSYMYLKGSNKNIGESYLEPVNYGSYFDSTLPTLTESEFMQGTEYEDITLSREDMIKSACDIYQLNYDYTYKILAGLTDNFSSINFLEGKIPGLSCKGMNIEAQSEYEFFIYACRILKQDPERWNVNTSNLYIKNGYSSGYDYCALIEKVANVIGVDKHLMYAIIQSETGFRSDLFINFNNPAGLKSSIDDFWEFDNLEEGLYEFAMEVKKYYYMIGKPTTDLSMDTIAQIGEIHAPTSDGNENWLPNVLSVLESTLEHSEELFGRSVQSNGLSH